MSAKYRYLYGALIIVALGALIAYKEIREHQAFMESPAGKKKAKLDSIMSREPDSSVLDQPCGLLHFELERTIDSILVIDDEKDTSIVSRLGPLYVKIAECDPTNEEYSIMALMYLSYKNDHRRSLKTIKRLSEDASQRMDLHLASIAMMEAIGDTDQARNALRRYYKEARNTIGTFNQTQDYGSLYHIVTKAEDRYHLNDDRKSIKPEIKEWMRRDLKETMTPDSLIEGSIGWMTSPTPEKIDSIILWTPIDADFVTSFYWGTFVR
jgi:hypothetical protein